MTKQLGVIGYPLSHSLSPIFQQAALDYHAIPVTYSAWPTPPERLSQTVERLRGAEYMGFNITIPHKEHLVELLDDVDAMARNIGAVNTVVNRGRCTGRVQHGYLRIHQEPEGEGQLRAAWQDRLIAWRRWGRKGGRVRSGRRRRGAFDHRQQDGRAGRVAGRRRRRTSPKH